MSLKFLIVYDDDDDELEEKGFQDMGLLLVVFAGLLGQANPRSGCELSELLASISWCGRESLRGSVPGPESGANPISNCIRATAKNQREV